MKGRHRGPDQGREQTRDQGRVCPLLLVCLLLVKSLCGAAGARELQRGRAVTVQWLSPDPSRRDLHSSEQEFPARGEVLISSRDLQLVLLVQHNHDLLAPGFTETFYTEDGEPVTEAAPDPTDHCFFHGTVQGHSDSWTALSTCSGIRAFISLNDSTFYLEPLTRGPPLTPPNHITLPTHSLLRTTELSLPAGRCGHHLHPPSSSHTISRLNSSLHSRVKRNSLGTTKYVELYIVADNALFQRQNQDYQKTKARIMEIANYVDKFYRAVNIRVPLIGVEVWTDRDQCVVTGQPNATLWSFLRWRQRLKAQRNHDNAQLLTGVVFGGTTIGMAPLEGMCSVESSGGINMDHSELPVGAAATMAHELGHNLGMNHDHHDCCDQATAEQGGCLMAAATGHPFPRVFSRCSKRDLDNYLQKGGGMCLYNRPNMKQLVGGRKCGNGFVEDGEECDCGEPDECINDCCHANNCTLKGGAQCAHGVCCGGCQLQQAGTMCRGPAGACDLPEYCTGASAYCPANVYLLDGSGCQGGRAYCYQGMCLTHQQQCLQLWGYGASPAHHACFEDVNSAGNAFGNCGKDQHGNYTKCHQSDALCGKIQCLSAAKKPRGTNAVSIDTTIMTNGVEVKCRGTFVYSTQDGEGDLPDPGLVMTGTKCGDGKVCKERKCINASFTHLETCISQCHGHGVCNSNHNCHCDPGWAPPLCDKPGLGGSVDSGPVHPHSQLGLVVGLLFSFLVLLPALLLMFYCYKIKTSFYHQWLSNRHRNSQVKKSTDQRKIKGHANFTFHLKEVESSPGRSHSSNGVFPPSKGVPLTAAPAQLVNVVRPLGAPRSPQGLPRGGAPRPNSRPPVKPFKAILGPDRLPPPRKPLPLNPRTSALVAPQRPLPLSPTLAPPPSTSKASSPLLVMMPPTTEPLPVTTPPALPPLRVSRPAPGPGPRPKTSHLLWR